jgi:huntingtin interacting protein 1
LQEDLKELERKTEVGKLADANFHLDFLIGTFEKVIKSQLEELDSPRLTGDFGLLDYYVCRCEETPKTFQKLQETTSKGYATQDSLHAIIKEIPEFGQEIEFLIVYGGPLSRTCKDIQQGDDLLADVRNLGTSSLELLQSMKKRGVLDARFADILEKWKSLLQKVKRLGSSLTPEQDAAEVLDKELQAMEQAIEEAARRMEEILKNSRASDTGIKLEVNEKLIDSCSSLMNAIRILVQKSKGLQIEIVSQGRGTSSAKEFYKRNHQWTDGLISAAKAVGIGAKLLLESADKAVTCKGGGFEYLIASSQEIAASTIQLVVASQVRADRSSKNLAQVKQASSGVKTATAHVVATAKDCSQLIEESDIDVGKVTPHNAKRLELEEQAEVLRLESQLEKSRRRLAALRQHHYHNEDN